MALTLVVAQVVKVTLLELLGLGLCRPRAARAASEEAQSPQELRLVHQQALVLAVAVLEAVVEKARDVSLATVIVAVAVRVVINRVAGLLVVDKALPHSLLAQTVHTAAAVAAAVLVILA